MTSHILTLFTRTPLHVGAGASVGAIDQPIIRERHTGFPIIPGSSLKGVLADLWHIDTDKTSEKRDLSKPITWLFGSDNDKESSAGALSFGEARLLAFPIRSARGSFAWLTSPTLLARAARDGVLTYPPTLSAPYDNQALFAAATSPTAIPPANGAPKHRLVLEDHNFTHAGELPANLAAALTDLLPGEPMLGALTDRLVIISDGMMSFFAKTAREIAQHVRINDATGTADDGGLFNQENVPAETLFYAVIHAPPGRSAAHRDNKPDAALNALRTRLGEVKDTLQIGGDATGNNKGRFASPVLLRPHRTTGGKIIPLIIFVDAHRWPLNHQVYLHSGNTVQPRDVSLELYEEMKTDKRLSPFLPYLAP